MQYATAYPRLARYATEVTYIAVHAPCGPPCGSIIRGGFFLSSVSVKVGDVSSRLTRTTMDCTTVASPNASSPSERSAERKTACPLLRFSDKLPTSLVDGASASDHGGASVAKTASAAGRRSIARVGSAVPSSSDAALADADVPCASS